MVRITGFLCLLALTLPAAGQDLSIVATEPAAGDSSVALQTTVEFTFSAPLDTTARFSGETPFEFFAINPPDSIEIDSVYFNEDLTQVSFDVTHADSTDFVWILTGAQDQRGNLLCQPSVLSYTTAETRGSYVMSGQVFVIYVTKNGFCAPGFVVALLDGPPAQGGRVVAATRTEYEGPYVMKGLRGGTYWPVVFFDFDGNGIFTPDWDWSPAILAEAGFYDADWDLKPDSIVVADSNLVDIQIFFFGVGTESQPDLPERAFLLPNYPNPFNPQTTLSFRLERPARIELSVHDLLGRKVATVVKGLYLTGLHEVTWDAHNLPSSLYVVRLRGEDFVLTQPIMLVK